MIIQPRMLNGWCSADCAYFEWFQYIEFHSRPLPKCLLFNEDLIYYDGYIGRCWDLLDDENVINLDTDFKRYWPEMYI